MGDADVDDQVMDEEGQDVNLVREGAIMDEAFREENTVEVEFDSDDDVPVDSDEDGGGLADDQCDDVGVTDEALVHQDDEELLQFAGVDDAVTSVAHKESVLSVAMSPSDRSTFATGGQDDVAVLWRIEERPGGLACSERVRLEGHTDSVTQIAFSHDGQYVATGSYDGTVRIWLAATGALVHALDGPSKEVEWITWHPKGHAILAGSNDTLAWMWWAPSGKLMQIFAGHGGGVTCGCWPLGGKLICTGSEDKSVIVWNPRQGAPQQHVRQLHERGIVSICAHPEAPIIVTGSEDGVAKVVHIETGKTLATLSGHTDSVEAVAFSKPTAAGLILLATASMDGQVQVFDGTTYAPRCVLRDHVSHGGIVRFKWFPEGLHCLSLCTCATDRTIRLFNALSGQCTATFRGHTDSVLDLDLLVGDHNGAQHLCIVSASDDKTSRIFMVPMDPAATAGTSALLTGAAASGYPAASASAPPMAPLAAAPAPADNAAGGSAPAPVAADAIDADL